MGSPKAITAVAHQLARIVYAMLTGRADYVKEDQSVHDKRYRERAIKSLQRRAQVLGMTLTIKPV
jgi:transposase